MAAEFRATILSPNLEEYRSVEDVRRFAVFSKMLLGSLRDHYSADFTVMLHSESPNGFSSFKSKVISSVGVLPDGFEDQVLNRVKKNGNTPGTFAGKFDHVAFPEAECFVQRLSVTERDSVLFLLGFESVNPPTGETGQQFAESLEKIQSEISDIFLISQQAQKIEDLRLQLEAAEDQLDSPGLDLSRGIEQLEVSGESESVIGVNTCSPLMKSVLNQISKIGLSDLSLLIRGEVGTGKAFLARKVHDHSNQKDSPFEMISCGALTPSLVEGELFGWKKGAFSGADEDRPGLFERANGGTVFLDEVSELPQEIQQKLLRVIQENEVRPIGSSDPVAVECRIISSSCKDLMELVHQGEFREDLYYRLSGFQCEVPPLRERSEDMQALINGFLFELRNEHGISKRFSESASQELCSFPWPGNIQQLKNVVQQAYLMSEKRVVARKVVLSVMQDSTADALMSEKFAVTPEEICIRIPRTEGFNEIVSEVERAVIVSAMQQNRGNKSRVTKQLKIPRQTLYNKLERFSISEDEWNL